MATALDVAEVVYKRFAEGDIEGFLALWPIDIEWVVNGPATLDSVEFLEDAEACKRS
jgi:ketosteroid isomerase-like protein